MRVETSQAMTKLSERMSNYLRFGWPILCLVGLIGTSVFLLLADIARSQDETYETNTRDYVQQATQAWVGTNTKISNEYALWTDAYEKATLADDQAWMAANFMSENTSSAAIVRPGVGLRFSYVNPKYKSHESALRTASAQFDLGAHSAYQKAPSAQTTKISPNGLYKIDGVIVAVAGQPIRPDSQYDGVLPNAQQPIDIAVITTLIEPTAVSQLGYSYRLVDAQLRVGKRVGPPDPDKIYYDLIDGQGAEIGWIEWQNIRPGSTAYAQRFWPILLCLFLVGAGAWTVTYKLASERIKFAQEARRAAEEASRTKSSFLANISHELRTPLNAIIGFTELIKEDCEDAGVAQGVKDSEKVIGSAQHLLGLINDLLDHAKIEAGKMDLNPTLTDLVPLFALVGETMGPQIAKNSSRLVVNCDPNIGAAMIDGMRLKQCLLNLVSNAAKFTKNGTVTIFARAVDRDGVDFLRIAVKDDGVGMSPETVSKLFAPYVQADASTASKFGGTGLGLMITRALVDAMGGEVCVESELGKGSTFTLMVPRGLEAIKPAALAQAA
jgi:signal transduction histidine kinase